MKTEKGGRVEKNVVRKAVYLGGMCPRCEGMGSVNDFDLTAIYDETKSLADGALHGARATAWTAGTAGSSAAPASPWTSRSRSTPRRSSRSCSTASPTKIKVEGVNLTYEGVLPKVQKSMLSKDVEAMQPHVRRFVERAVTFQTCPDCDGTRLTKEARSSKINGKNIADLCAMQISDLADWLRGVEGAGGRAAARRAAAPARLVRRDRAGLPLARPARPARCPAARPSAPR